MSTKLPCNTPLHACRVTSGYYRRKEEGNPVRGDRP